MGAVVTEDVVACRSNCGRSEISLALQKAVGMVATGTYRPALLLAPAGATSLRWASC